MELKLIYDVRGNTETVYAGNNDVGDVAVWRKSTKATPRGSSSYDAHRRAKGDNYNYGEVYESEGRASDVLAAIIEQLPQPMKDAQFTIDPTTADEWEIFNFVSGLAVGGCAWFGVTPKKTIARIKAAQKTFVIKM